MFFAQDVVRDVGLMRYTTTSVHNQIQRVFVVCGTQKGSLSALRKEKTKTLKMF